MTHGERICEHLREHGVITAPECPSLFGFSRIRASNVLRELCEAGVIVALPGKFPRRYKMARDFAAELPGLGAGRVTTNNDKGKQ